MLLRPPVRVRLLDWREAAPLVTPLRTRVFVDEQHVPLELELDAFDAASLHAVATDDAGEVMGTGRLLPDGHIGRMAVTREARGVGVGSAVLSALVDEARRRGFRTARLNAQVSAAAFYARHGFTPHGATFLDAGIEHVAMSRAL